MMFIALLKTRTCNSDSDLEERRAGDVKGEVRSVLENLIGITRPARRRRNTPAAVTLKFLRSISLEVRRFSLYYEDGGSKTLKKSDKLQVCTERDGPETVRETCRDQRQRERDRIKRIAGDVTGEVRPVLEEPRRDKKTCLTKMECTRSSNA